MKRKPKLAPRNPLVAASLFRKAGSHDKPFKAKRRADKMDLMACSSAGRARGFYPLGREFEPRHANPQRLQTHGIVAFFCRVRQLFAVSIPQ
jgi:hypothetical protein